MENEEIEIMEEAKSKRSDSTVLDVISGRESIKFDLGIDWKTILYICAAAILIGTILILIKKMVLR